MTKKLFLLSFIALAIIIGGCSKESPVAPDLMGSNSGESLAKATHTVVNFIADEGKAKIVDPGTQWVDEQGILHIRGQVGEGAPVSGDLVGTDLRNVFNVDINTATGSGPFVGTFYMEVEWPARNLKGAFRGAYKGVITNGYLTGTTTGMGEGGFAGMVLRAEQKEEVAGSYKLLFTGTVTEHNQ